MCRALGLYRDGHAYVGEGLLQVDDVLVAEAYAALAVATGHRVLVVCASVDADAGMPRCLKAQEPCAIGFNTAAPVAKVMAPAAGVLYLLNLKRFPLGRFGSSVVAFALLLPFVAT